MRHLNRDLEALRYRGGAVPFAPVARPQCSNTTTSGVSPDKE